MVHDLTDIPTASHDREVYIAQAKSQRRANTLVFGLLPLNRLAPDNPGRINHSDRGSSSTSDTKSANRPTEGCKTGQKGADGQPGTTSVPTALHTLAWPITLGMSATGGYHQLFSPPSLQKKRLPLLHLGSNTDY